MFEVVCDGDCVCVVVSVEIEFEGVDVIDLCLDGCVDVGDFDYG